MILGSPVSTMGKRRLLSILYEKSGGVEVAGFARGYLKGFL
jgi:hypothetical protein